MALTARQQRFVDEYIVDLCATQAAIRAGYAEKTANREGSRLLSNVDIQEAIAAAKDARKERTQLTADMVVQRLAMIAFQDIRTIYRPDGTLKHPGEWDDAAAAAVASVEVFEESEGRGEKRTLVGHTKKVRRWDQVKVLELLGRHLDIFGDPSEQAARLAGLMVVTLEEVRAARQRAVEYRRERDGGGGPQS